MSAQDCPSFIEAVMTQALYGIGRVYWNINQQPWGKMAEEMDDKSAPEAYFPMQLGTVMVSQQEFESGDLLLLIIFNDLCVSSWFDSKRLFYHAHLSRDVTIHEMADWYVALYSHLREIDKQLPQQRKLATEKALAEVSPEEACQD